MQTSQRSLGTLPRELQERILIHLREDPWSLRSFALTNQVYRSMSQKLLFETIHLSLKSGSFPRLCNFFTIFGQKNSPLLSYIKHLHMEWGMVNLDQYFTRTVRATLYLFLTSPIQSISVDSSELGVFHSLTVFRNELRRLFEGAHLQRVALTGVTGATLVRLVENLQEPKLKELRLVRSKIHAGPDGATYIGNEYERGFDIPCRHVVVQRLTVVDTTFHPAQNFLPEIIDLTQIEELRINQPASPLASSVFTECKDSVEHLTIYDDAPYDPSGNLRSLGVHFNDLPDLPKNPIELDFTQWAKLKTINIGILLLADESNDSVRSEALESLGSVNFVEGSVETVSITIASDFNPFYVLSWAATQLLPLDSNIFIDIEEGKTLSVKSFSIQVLRVGVDSSLHGNTVYMSPNLMPRLHKSGILKLLPTRDLSEDEIKLYNVDRCMYPHRERTDYPLGNYEDVGYESPSGGLQPDIGSDLDDGDVLSFSPGLQPDIGSDLDGEEGLSFYPPSPGLIPDIDFNL